MNDQNNPVISRVTRQKSSFDWEISNFSEIYEKSQSLTCIESSKFQNLVCNKVTEWKLLLGIKEDEERASGVILLFLKCLSDDTDAYIKASFAIVNVKNNLVNLEATYKSLSYCLFQKGKCSHDGCCYLHFTDLFNNKEDLLPGDKLTIRCEIFLDKCEEYYQKIENGRVEDFEDFGMLFMNEKLSDIKILIDDNTFHAHKHVLAKKSEVFAAMFKHDMLENNENSVKIEDVSFEAMSAMLRYIYLNRIFYIQNSTYLELIMAADKYQIMDLKAECENKILKQLKFENSIALLTVADQSNALTLKTEIIDFIVENGKILIGKPEFSSMTQLHPEILCELFRKMTLSRKW